jgi:hypothetical protein
MRFKVADVARIFGKTERTIYTWLDLWETYHFAGLYEKTVVAMDNSSFHTSDAIEAKIPECEPCVVPRIDSEHDKD